MNNRKSLEAKYASFPDLLTTKELEAMFPGINVKSLRGVLWRNEIQHFRIGNRYMIPKANVIDYMLTAQYQELLKHVSATRLAAVLQQTLETDRARLLAFCSTRRSRKEMMLMLNITSPKLFYRLYLNPLLETGELRRVIPDRPCVSTQQYIRAFRVQY